MSGKKKKLTLVAQSQEFFRELVSDALGRKKVTTQPETEFYLVNLMNRFIKADHLYSQDGSGSNREEALAILVKEALEAPVRQARNALFRHIGDVSLYTAGYFQESLNRKLVDVNYYIDIGGTAYMQVANQVEEEAMKPVYEELAQKFGDLVDVLADISQQTSPRSEKDILRLYELWVRTRSERAAKALQKAGIIPDETVAKKWQ